MSKTAILALVSGVVIGALFSFGVVTAYPKLTWILLLVLLWCYGAVRSAEPVYFEVDVQGQDIVVTVDNERNS